MNSEEKNSDVSKCVARNHHLDFLRYCASLWFKTLNNGWNVEIGPLWLGRLFVVNRILLWLDKRIYWFPVLLFICIYMWVYMYVFTVTVWCLLLLRLYTWSCSLCGNYVAIIADLPAVYQLWTVDRFRGRLITF